MRKTIGKVFCFIDKQALLIVSGFLMVFIPLYPKLPLFSPIETYVVRVRLEDFFVLFGVLVWMIQVKRTKVKWEHPLMWLIVVYVFFGWLSLLSAVSIVQTIPWEKTHFLKSLLHWLRYIEYFFLFVITYSAIRSRRQVELLLQLLAGVVSLSVVYGLGQRYLRWPVYSTMNREYSKGVRLVLESPYARVQSTFAGHYDFGAYLVVVLPFLLSGMLFAKKKMYRYLFGVSWVLGVWGMLMSASRSSFIGFLLGTAIVVGLKALLKKGWQKKVVWGLSRGFGLFLVIGVMTLFLGGNIFQLFVQTVEGIPWANKVWQPVKHMVINANPQSQVEEETGGAVIPQFTMPVPAEELERPPDVYVDIPDKVEVVMVNEEGKIEVSYQERPRVFSECAQEKGLSLCIRLEALWPQAIEGFKKNPVLGSGYATLNKQNLYHLTEADGTDNNFLRTLGETGLLGFLAFYGIIGWACWLAVKGFLKNNGLQQLVCIGYLAAVAGLLVNAVYIDVFAASKVAFGFWGITALMAASNMVLVGDKKAIRVEL